MKLDLTRDEAVSLLKLLDVSVKAGGLNTAEQVVHFHKKIEAANEKEEADMAEKLKSPPQLKEPKKPIKQESING